MQAAVHLAPPLLSQYAHPALNRGLNNPGIMPTPPVPTRKRKRAIQYSVNYSEVQEVDNSGRMREVIVIEDTPPAPPSTVSSPASSHNHLYSASYQPPTYSAQIRTRARAAAEAQALSASTSANVAPPPKKRRREQLDLAGAVAKKSVANGHLQNVANTNKSWASGSGATVDDVRVQSCLHFSPSADGFKQASKNGVPCDDKEGHYIIVPDDMIYRRCKQHRRWFEPEG